MRKHFLVVASVLFGFSPAFAALPSHSHERVTNSRTRQSGQIRWYTNYSAAVAVAKKENKPILFFFTGSDWCGWCKKMHQEVFSSPEFAKELGQKFVFIEVDFPMNKPLPTDQQQENNKLKKMYGITGYPTIVVIDANGNFIAEVGYRPGGGKVYAEYLKQLLE